ncbi:MAG: hypothetical protein LUF33_07535 [Clostridiales bacterium]|nr:hypothetical protein [Clostridiales bacterium]
MNRYPSVILVTLAAFLLAASLSLISAAYWVASNLLAILVTVGCIGIVIYFIATTYSYYHGIKSIKENFYFEERERLLISLRNKTIKSAMKAALFMLVYAGLWGIVIYFVNTRLL